MKKEDMKEMNSRYDVKALKLGGDEWDEEKIQSGMKLWSLVMMKRWREDENPTRGWLYIYIIWSIVAQIRVQLEDANVIAIVGRCSQPLSGVPFTNNREMDKIHQLLNEQSRMSFAIHSRTIASVEDTTCLVALN